jgi:hypothetical protein
MFYGGCVSSLPVLDSPFSEDSPDAAVLAHLFDSALEDQFATNQRAAARAETLAEIMSFTRAHPHVYAFTEHSDAFEIAERAVVRDAALRFQVSENTVRALAATAEIARRRLPRLWQRAKDGFAALAQVETAVSLLAVVGDSSEATAAFDAQLADAVVRLGAQGYKAFARRTARRLSEIPPETRHRDAAARRRVVIEPTEDGMAWLSAYLPVAEAIAAHRRLTATAKHQAKTHRDGRTREQMTADLLSAWLRGEGTPTAVKTKVLVTVPANLLTDAARATVRHRVPGSAGPDLNREPLLDGSTPIDAHTAVAALLRAGNFTRVITDPVTGVILDMDRRARTATRAQRDWLTLAYATCAVDGCEHPAATADIDHWLAYHGPSRGPTDVGNLHPFCGNDHVVKTRSRLEFERTPDGSVRVHSPAITGIHEPRDDEGLRDQRPGGPRTEERCTEARGTEEPHTEELGTEERGTEEPRTEEPRTEEHPDDADEIRRLTSARARIERATYGDDPPF